MPRYLTRGFQLALDLSVLSVAIWLGFLLRFELALPASYVDTALVYWPLIVAFEYATLVAFAVPRYSWRYVSLRETARISLAVLASAAVLFAFRLAFDEPLGVENVPISVLSSNALIAIAGQPPRP